MRRTMNEQFNNMEGQHKLQKQTMQQKKPLHFHQHSTRENMPRTMSAPEHAEEANLFVYSAKNI